MDTVDSNNSSESKTRESSVEASSENAFETKSTVSANPFATKTEKRVLNLDPNNLLYSGSKLHKAEANRQLGTRNFGRDRYNVAKLHDELFKKYLAVVGSGNSLEYLERQKNLTTWNEKLFYPDMALELDEPAGDAKNHFRYLFVHSVVLKRCEFIDRIIKDFQENKGKSGEFLVIPVKNCLHDNVYEILRFFYCREIAIDVSDDRKIEDLKTLAKIFRQQDLDFAMTTFCRQQQDFKKDQMNPFKVPDRPLKPNAFKKKMEGAKKSAMFAGKIEIKQKSSRFDPFGSLAKVNKNADQPKKEKVEINNNADKGSSQQILDGFLKDCQNNIGKYQENATESSSGFVESS